MKTTLKDPITTLAGMPFLDDGFDSGQLLAAVAAVRHVRAENLGIDGASHADLGAWLGPGHALLLQKNPTPMPGVPLSPDRQTAIGQVLDGLVETIPAWQPLVRLPSRFLLLDSDDGAISASCRDWPQYVLLAPAAFAHRRELREQVTHELCHQWLYMIQEVWRLAEEGAEDLILPSGTADRTPSEVLGAAHVAAALVRLHRTDPAGAHPQTTADHIRYLLDYGRGCLSLLDGIGSDLTEAGRAIAQRLKEAL
ncbi:aKG-HExxH-type peptide beta-hydroxylase [Nonomuraea ceibae]|uniref:aKG-HExxH-type peptide beta-hydroxylase n=1 Tax=Nonomuraea ceibae TaxID=1935170 RepID=UPI001C5CF797|nr:HEXXH motif-containing putative peptide modification protein [Nonomuraea ceibae]